MDSPSLVFDRCPKVGQEVPRGIKKRSLHAPTTECCRRHHSLSHAQKPAANFIARQPPLAQFSWAVRPQADTTGSGTQISHIP